MPGQSRLGFLSYSRSARLGARQGRTNPRSSGPCCGLGVRSLTGESLNIGLTRGFSTCRRLRYLDERAFGLGEYRLRPSRFVQAVLGHGQEQTRESLGDEDAGIEEG